MYIGPINHKESYNSNVTAIMTLTDYKHESE